MSLAACRFLRGRVKSKCIHLLIFKRGNVHCAWDSYFHQTVDKPLPSVAAAPLHELDQTGHRHLSHGGDVDRSCQKQVRTRGRKRAPSPTTDYPPPTRQTTRLCQNGSHAPRVSCKNGSNLETSAVHCSGRRRSCGGTVRDSGCIGSTSPERLLPTRRSPQRPWP